MRAEGGIRTARRVAGRRHCHSVEGCSDGIRQTGNLTAFVHDWLFEKEKLD